MVLMMVLRDFVTLQLPWFNAGAFKRFCLVGVIDTEVMRCKK